MNQIRTIFYSLFLLSALLSCNQKKKLNPTESESNPKSDSIVKKNKLFDLELSLIDSTYFKNKQDTIKKYYQENWVKGNMSGSFLVAKNGQILYENYQGFSNIKENIPITSETPIHLASISKVLTATAILKLIDAKKLDLDQKVYTVLETFPYPDITIKMLLNHRSGLKNYAYFTWNKDVWDPTKLLSNKDILMLLGKHDLPLDFKPDSRFAYCNTNYAILALIIEEITDQPYETAMKEIIFDPLEMNNTFVFDYNRDSESSCLSYKANNKEYRLNYLDDIYGDKNIYSTPRDLLKFDLASYSKPFLSEELIDAAFKGYSYERKGIKNYGLGIRLMEWNNGQKMFYHNGWWHGNTSSYVKLVNDTVAIIALSNKFNLKTYKVRNLSSLFGDYPFKLNLLTK